MSTYDPLREAERYLEQSRAAKERGDLKQALYYDHWAVQRLIHGVGDYARAMDIAVQAALDARKPLHQNQQDRICIQRDVISIYSGIDKPGYAEMIKEYLDYMERETPRHYNCFFCLLGERADYELQLGTDESAGEAVSRYVAESEGEPHYYAHALSSMCELLHKRGDYEKMLYFAQKSEPLFSVREDYRDDLAESQAAQALALFKLGRPAEARIAARKAVNTGSVYQGALTKAYYLFLAEYHHAAGELTSAIEVRQHQVTGLLNKGQFYPEARARFEVVRLKKERGDDITEDVAELRKLIVKLRKPDVIEDRLTALLAE